MIEVPYVVPFPIDDPTAPPCVLLDKESIFLKVAIFLASKGYIALMSTFLDEDGRVLLSHIPERLEHVSLRAYRPKYLNQNLARCYADFLLGFCKSSEHAALVAALIAKNRGAYYYWSSFGRVQSSQDVLLYLRIKQDGPTCVYSSNETYFISSHQSTKKESIETIPLEYAVAVKRYENLGENDAIKAALIHVCKLWNISLRCTSFRDDAEEEHKIIGNMPWSSLDDWIEMADKAPAVYPLEPEDRWIITALE